MRRKTVKPEWIKAEWGKSGGKEEEEEEGECN